MQYKLPIIGIYNILMPGHMFIQYNLPIIVIFRLWCQAISDSIITIVKKFLTGANGRINPGQNNGGRR